MGMHELSRIWPDWQIEGKPLGIGSYGAVYKAVRRDNLVESYAAIKVISIPKSPAEIDALRSEGLNTERATAYLQGLVNDCVSEIQLMESLKGIQNIVSVEDYKVVKKTNEIGWDIYIRMELLTPLTTYIGNRYMAEADVIKLGCDICTALEVCNKKGIVHRDIKPENIFVNEFGDYKLGDFGIARKLEGQMGNLSRKGTPNYMAPEVANSSDYDSRVDIYSLGIVLYRYLNQNRLPFLHTEEQITSPVERENAFVKRLRGEKLPPPTNASAGMADVVLQACEHNPNARFQDATQMKKALQAVLDGTARKRKKRNTGKRGVSLNVISIIAAAAIVAGLAGLYATGILPRIAEKVVGLVNNGIEKIQSTFKYGTVDEEELLQLEAIIADAEERAQTEDYEGAIAVIEAGLQDYPKAKALKDKLVSYNALRKEQIKAETLAEAQTFIDAEDYEGAIAFLQEAISQQGRIQEYLDVCEACQVKHDGIIRAEAVAEAKRLSSNGDYLGAVLVLDELMKIQGSDEELSSWMASLEADYVSQVVKQADNLLIREDYDGADNTVKEALAHFPNNELLRAESQRILNARPVYLLDEVTPYKKAARYTDSGPVRMGDKNYLHGFTCMGYGDYDEGNQVFFNLDGKYSLISFTAGIVVDRGQKVTFLFHADGELVYKFTMHSGDIPTKHVFNIVGCKQFKISVYDGRSTIEKSGTYGLADIMVKRNVANMGDDTPVLNENQVYLLNEMMPYKTADHYESASNLSMGGQYFSNGFSCMGYGESNVGNEVYFNLDGKYSKITFTAGIVQDRGLTVTYRFFADGKLAYEFKLGESDLASTHSFSVEGCRQLRICVYDKQKTADASGTYGIAEIIMDKSSAYNENSEDNVTLQSGEHYLLDVVKPSQTPSRYDDLNEFKMGGKRYSNGFTCMGYGDYNKGNQTYFNLDGKYSQISFTAGIVMDRDVSVTFRFKADGKTVYEFTMKKGDLPTEHSFSVEGCSELVISVYDRQKGADTSGTYGLANIVVTE